jgi:hypothetical protein
VELRGFELWTPELALGIFSRAVEAVPRLSVAAARPLRPQDGDNPDNSSPRPSVQRGFELESGFRLRIYSEFGMARPIAEKFMEGGRLLGLPD